jgi:pimeloyl-ACP methyl ester carboxylesterase
MSSVSTSSLQYVRQGNTGPVLLFVHGFPLSHQQWQSQISEFAKTHQVIAPDLRGLGTSPLKSGQTKLTTEDHADDLVVLLDNLQVKEPVILAGLSMGGYIAWQMVRKYPERLRALILCNTRVVNDTPEQAAARFQLAEKTLQLRSPQAILDVMLPKLLPPVVNPAIVDAVKQMAHQTTPEGLAANLHALATRPNVTSMLPAIAIPSLVISSEFDTISSPAEMGQWAAMMPQARFVSLPGVGHITSMEAPEHFNKVVRENAPW